MSLQDFFEVRISEDKLSAHVLAAASLESTSDWTREEWDVFLKEEGVVFGVLDENIDALVNDPSSVDFPIEVAIGIAPKDGAHAYIKPAIEDEKQQEMKETKGAVNLKNVVDIPMVEQGELVGEKVAAEKGSDGRAVDNEPLEAKRWA
ncbi:flagellar assembly protein A [Alteribacillus bidgolensis]|uniref:Flagellar Assembly Protein A N-terminal region domain-containing protein n=1 Tax=Alteribacillus bidgolensis TaxID=930129 RepID=A0A1G8GG95_9BACI|nr:Protein of unknown function [Alteribacillus bidgolensis]